MRASKVLRRKINPLLEFLKTESAGGIVLMVAAIVAIALANSPANAGYQSVLQWRLHVGVDAFAISKPLILWINDGLMAIFFFLVGMELKREVVEGHLSSIKKALLPALAAAGGMLFPALFYAYVNQGNAEALRGWAIPTATDIAFALGVLSLLGSRVPSALKAFLLSVAIFDDLGAIVVIALFYTETISLVALGVAAACVVALTVLNRSGVRRIWPYLLIGLPLWVAVLKSGVHATIAGVVLALFIPLAMPGNRDAETDVEASPLSKLEHALHPWVAFLILPIFAFANAGVPLAGLSVSDVLQPIPLGIILGLFLGKQIGVMLCCYLAVKMRVAALPSGVRWSGLYGVAILSGIGFTMSLFIASLSFGGQGSGLERLGILIGSGISGVLGYIVLRLCLGKAAETHQAEG